MSHEKLAAIWRDGLAYRREGDNYFAHPGLTPEQESEARDLYAGLRESEPEAAVVAHAKYAERGVNLGDAPPLPRADFGGEWMQDDDDAPESYAGYDCGRRWNGFAVPMLPRAEAERLAAEQARIIERDGGEHYAVMTFDANDDLIVQYPESQDSHRVEVVPEMTLTADGEILLYDVGLGWVWDIIDPDADEDDEDDEDDDSDDDE
jgi:hypothetical protein